MKKLEEKQKRFCEEYLKDCNGTQAAIRAGYSKRTARVQAAQNLSKLNIQQEIVRLRAKQTERTEIKADEILRGLYEIATFDIGELFDENNRLKPIHDLSPVARRVLASIDNEELFDYEAGERTRIGWLKKIKLWSKDKALENLGRHFKLFTDVVRVEGGLAEKLKKARERVGKSGV